jgi:TonB family protein
MKPSHTTRLLFAALWVVVTVAPEHAAQQAEQRGPAPKGTTLDARDGDTVVIEDDARVRVIHRRRAHVRAVFDPTRRWLILLAQYLPQSGPRSNGVDDAYTFREIEGNWTLGNKWEADTTIERYSLAGQSGGPAGFGFQTPQGTVQLFSRNQQQFRDPGAALVLVFRGFDGGRSNGVSFDQVEKLKIEEAMGTRAPAVSAGVSGGVVVDPQGRLPSAGLGSPRKIHDVRPVWPEEARRAGVQGTVIVELTIGIDGAVADVRILRGFPLLDRAALECVRQWRYEPTLLNGQPIPMRITATVTFP